MNEIKALFLDIDGVVNSSRSVIAKIGPIEDSEDVKNLEAAIGPTPYGARHALRTVDPVCVALVNKLLAADEKIWLVLSSTHRLHFRESGYGTVEHLRKLRAYLTTMGFTVPANFDITDNLGTQRGVEVAAWIDDAEIKRSEIVNDYAILDDGKDFEYYQNLVWCDPTHGIGFKEYADACKCLAIQEPGMILT